MLSAGNVTCAHMCADLQVFIDSKYRLAYNGRYTTDEEITGMLIAVLFAGQHTSSVTCTWTLLSMLANQVRGLTLQPAAPHACPAYAPCTSDYIAVRHKCNQLHVCCSTSAARACMYEFTVCNVSNVSQYPPSLQQAARQAAAATLACRDSIISQRTAVICVT